MRDGLRGGDPHPQTGEQPRSDIHCHQAHLGQLHLSLIAQESDGGRDRFRVATVAGGVERRDDAFVAADGHPHLRRRGLDAKD